VTISSNFPLAVKLQITTQNLFQSGQHNKEPYGRFKPVSPQYEAEPTLNQNQKKKDGGKKLLVLLTSEGDDKTKCNTTDWKECLA
jgi:hypothetical protein